MNSRNTGIAICLGLFAVILGTAQTPKPTNRVDTAPLMDSIEGPALYKAYCATCHGTDGKGFGPMAAWLKIKTPDLTRISMANNGTFPLTRVRRIISGEENVVSGHGTREMPVWGPIFSQVSADQDWGQMRIYNLAAYIGKMQAKQ
jgi:mono/diheme cytochrome c family protein